MRDVILTAVIAAMLVATLRQPVVGSYLWAWLGIMSPHRMTYGFAYSMPFAQITAVTTLLALAITRQRQALPMTGITKVLLAMLFWMTVTSFFAIAPEDVVIERWVFVMKIQVMLLVTLMLVLDARQLRGLVWVVTLSVAFYGVKGGIFTILTGGSGRVWGPQGGLLEGNNELAVGLVITVPFLFYLLQTESRKWVRRGLGVSIALCTFAILGTQSRGALLSLLAMGLLLGIKGKHPVRNTALIATLVVIAIAFMPESWTSRMSTIQTYEQDSSAMERIWTWNTLWNAAVDRPLIGAGFRADTQEVFARYAPTDGPFAVMVGRVFVAHSIYFQMLGEHGFPGLLLFLVLGVATWRMASRLARQTVGDEEFGHWVPNLMPMVQVSLVGFAVGGAFLSMAYFDVPYYLSVFVVLVDASVRERNAARASARRRPQPVPGSIDPGSTAPKE